MKCINCGNKIRKNAKFCDNCGIDQSKIEVISEKKNDNKLFIFVIIVLILLGCLLGFIIINHNSNKDKKENKENKEIVIDENKEIVLNNYKITISDDFKIEKEDSSAYIKGNEFTIMCSVYPLSYSSIIDNKEILIDEFKDQGYIIKSFNEYEDDKYILVEVSKDEIEYGFVFYEFDSETNIFATIASNYMNHFNKNWFNETVKLLKNNEKIEI